MPSSGGFCCIERMPDREHRSMTQENPFRFGKSAADNPSGLWRCHACAYATLRLTPSGPQIALPLERCRGWPGSPKIVAGTPLHGVEYVGSLNEDALNTLSIRRQLIRPTFRNLSTTLQWPPSSTSSSSQPLWPLPQQAVLSSTTSLRWVVA